MRIRYRRPTRLPGMPSWLRVNIGRRGITSVGVGKRLGWLGRLAVNLTHRTASWDHPGPGSVVLEPDAPVRRPRARRARRG